MEYVESVRVAPLMDVPTEETGTAAAAAVVVIFASLLAWKVLNLLERVLGLPPKDRKWPTLPRKRKQQDDGTGDGPVG
jgi:hypothetical protein